LRSDALREEFYTTGEAAALLKCSTFTIRRWIKSGVLRAEKLRGGKQQDSYRIPRASLQKVMGLEQCA
jgi:excisionase family DNA binding protein